MYVELLITFDSHLMNEKINGHMREREEILGTVNNLNTVLESLTRQSQEREHQLLEEITFLKEQVAKFSEERFIKVDQENKKYKRLICILFNIKVIDLRKKLKKKEILELILRINIELKMMN